MTKPLRAILPSMIALVATVVAWTTNVTSPASTDALGERALGRLHESLGGVGRRRQHLGDRDLARLLVDQGGIGERASDVDRQSHAHVVALLSSMVACSSMRRSVDRDQVLLARPLGADLAFEDVAQHARRIALLRRPVATAAAAADADDVARDELGGALRAEPGLDAVADQHVLGDRGVVAAEGAPRALPVAVGEDRERRRLQDPEVLAQPEPAAEPARALRVLDEREPGDLHRVVQLGLLDRRVLGVLAVACTASGPSLAVRGRRTRRPSAS